MHEDMLIVGGYGQVGRIISTRLASHYPGRVIVAGHNISGGGHPSLAGTEASKIRFRQFDIRQPKQFDAALLGIRLAVVSVERADDAFVRACLTHGVHYLEVATSHERLAEIVALRSLALEKGVAVIPGAGLIPGLSNILAAHCAQGMASVAHADIFVLLGLGDTHGTDAVRWMLDQGRHRFSVATRQGAESFANYSDPRWVHFPGDTVPRMAYRFNFGDQHVLPESIGAQAASSRLCFDSQIATQLLALVAQVGLLRLVRGNMAVWLARVLRHIPIGGDRFALQAEVASATGERVTASVTGNREADATGIVTALAARLLYEETVVKGVHFLENILTLAAIRGELEFAGMRVWANNSSNKNTGPDAGGPH